MRGGMVGCVEGWVCYQLYRVELLGQHPPPPMWMQLWFGSTPVPFVRPVCLVQVLALVLALVLAQGLELELELAGALPLTPAPRSLPLGTGCTSAPRPGAQWGNWAS